MKPVVFNEYGGTSRDSIVTLSPFYQSMVKEIKNRLERKNTINLCLCRINDGGISRTKPIEFFDVVREGGNLINVRYYGDHYNHLDERVPIEKTIRFDNPFGEIPVLPDYKRHPFFLIGKKLESYNAFIKDMKEILCNEIGKNIQLHYKNDDGTFSVVHGTLKEVNKGNILTDDFHEVLVRDNKSVRVDLLCSRTKNHRFISEQGYLCGLYPPVFFRGQIFDDGKVFGQTETWGFSTSKVA